MFTIEEGLLHSEGVNVKYWIFSIAQTSHFQVREVYIALRRFSLAHVVTRQFFLHPLLYGHPGRLI
jgi:hypothetical protein